MRAWPRTLENDPFHPGYIDIARNPQEAAQQDVILRFNEF